MLISREEMQFDFGGARFDLNEVEDREFLGWVFNQFLYGEVTGIQCGFWLYRAPHLAAATFLARQATEELSHVKRFLKMLSIVNVSPSPAHPVIRFLSTGMMGGSWGQHVAIEMALGEGLVLSVFYALQSTVGDPEISKLLQSSVLDEEKHVEFGEKETLLWLEKYPQERKLLLGEVLLQLAALRFLKQRVLKKLSQGRMKNHPVLKQFKEFFEHTISNFEKRIERLGIAESLSSLSFGAKIYWIGTLPLRKLSLVFRSSRRLTQTYLEDPWVRKDEISSKVR